MTAPEPHFLGLNTITLTGLTAMATIAVAVIYGRILFIMRDTMRLTDRPHLAIDWRTFRLRDWDHPTSAADPVCRSVTFTITNYGRSPGRPIRLIIQTVVHYMSQLEEEGGQKYRETEADTVGGIVLPNQTTPWAYSSREAMALSDDAIARWKSREPRRGSLFLYGFVDYLDGHGLTHRSCFAVRFVDWEEGKEPYFVAVTDPRHWRTT